jgi:hypothetical protein
MTAEHHTIPDILLERYRLEELPTDERAQLEDRIRGDETLRRRLEALDRSDEEIRRRYPPDELASQIQRRIDTNNRTPARARRRGNVYWVAPLAVAALVTLAALVAPRMAAPPPPSTGPAAAVDADRIKGLAPALALYRRTVQGSETLADGAVARAGDLLRIGYRAAGKPYGVILSIDGRGGVTVHLPHHADRAATLKRDGTVLLDEAYELDDAPQWERFYFITGDASFAVAPIVDAARDAATGHHDPPAALALPHGLQQSTFSIQKEARP